VRDADWFWLTLAATGTAVELWAVATKREHLTLSRTARRALRCHTKAGRAFTTVAIGAGASWLGHHLLTVNPEEIAP
jgi:hypothetical protein